MKKVTWLFVIASVMSLSIVKAQNTWTEKADFGGTVRSKAIGFSIGNKGYIGVGGSSNFSILNDFWEYDPELDVWTQKADFGGTPRYGAVAFSIGSKGYLGTGYDDTTQYLKDFWEYDTTANTWTQKADFGGTPRDAAVGFSISGKGYIGTGGDYLNDFWEYDPASDTWTQKADFAGAGRLGMAGFSLSSKGYIACGYDGTNFYHDFWEYDPATDSWSQKADFEGAVREFSMGFSIGDKGYFGTGYSYDGSYHYYRDFWEYDPSSNIWTQKADFGGSGRYSAFAFSIGNKAYVGCGYDSTATHFTKDVWEYAPSITSGISAVSNKDWSMDIYPNLAEDHATIQFTLAQSSHITIKVFDASGKEMKTMLNDDAQEGNPAFTEVSAGTHTLPLNLKDFPAGIYFAKMISDFGSETQKLMVQ